MFAGTIAATVMWLDGKIMIRCYIMISQVHNAGFIPVLEQCSLEMILDFTIPLTQSFDVLNLAEILPQTTGLVPTWNDICLKPRRQ